MKTALLLVVMLSAATIVVAQDPDYHYPFDGTVENSTANPASSGFYGELGYGLNRMDEPNSSIYGNGGGAYSEPTLLGKQTTVCFWYKSATEGVTLPASPTRYSILGSFDTTYTSYVW